MVPLVRGETNIGVFGVLRREKGQIHLINAVASLIGAGNRNVKLHIFGNGPDRHDLEQQVVQLGLGENIHFYGDVPDPEQKMVGMDIVAIPSLFESFGYVGLEAMSLKRPVIATAVGGLCEIFSSETALLVTPGNALALEHAISQYVVDPVSANAMAQRGYEFCTKYFSIDRMIETLSNEYYSAGRFPAVLDSSPRQDRPTGTGE